MQKIQYGLKLVRGWRTGSEDYCLSTKNEGLIIKRSRVVDNEVQGLGAVARNIEARAWSQEITWERCMVTPIDGGPDRSGVRDKIR